MRKSLNMLTGAFLFLAVLSNSANSAVSFEELASTYQVDGFVIRIHGRIVKGDNQEFRRILKVSTKRGLHLNHVSLDSEGGDLDEAIALGRQIRSLNEYVVLQPGAKCLSSCIIVYAGGSQRARGKLMGVHRPYLVTEIGSDDFQSVIKIIRQKLNAYFTEMNVPQTLTDLMMATPPERIHMLTAQEVEFYMPHIDPAEDERIVAERAADRGISLADYRQRRAAEDAECRQSVVLARLICENAISWGLSTLEYNRRDEIARDVCKSGNSGSCYARIMREGPP
jgi:hypothetical protein